jgi:polyisoprenoid-binding protein YceI
MNRLSVFVVTIVFVLTAAGAGASKINSASDEAANLTSNSNGQGPARYQLDASRSKFIAEGLAGGLLWFKGHNHLLAVRDFTGEARLDPDSIPSASLRLVAKAASLEETSDVFTPQQKQIINKELHDIVFHPDQYPDIVFQSTGTTGKATGNGRYDLKLNGNLTLHGVTRPIVIPAQVTVTGNEMRAVGKFSIDRSNYGVKATSAFHGLVRVKNGVKFTFDIVGVRQ